MYTSIPIDDSTHIRDTYPGGRVPKWPLSGCGRDWKGV